MARPCVSDGVNWRETPPYSLTGQSLTNMTAQKRTMPARTHRAGHRLALPHHACQNLANVNLPDRTCQTEPGQTQTSLPYLIVPYLTVPKRNRPCLPRLSAPCLFSRHLPRHHLTGAVRFQEALNFSSLILRCDTEAAHAAILFRAPFPNTDAEPGEIEKVDDLSQR